MFAVCYHLTRMLLLSETLSMAFLAKSHCLDRVYGKRTKFLLEWLFLKSLDLKDKISRKEENECFPGEGVMN